MTRIADAQPAGAPRLALSPFVLPAYVLTLFLSALLLFWVQPMFAKMVLPMLGGTPSVWNTAMLFFQTVLLAGYAYAHLTSRLLALRWQVAVHAAVVGLVFISLPIAVAEGWTPPTEGTPVLWLIGLLAVSLGLPFFAVSATAPLLQRWFSHSGHRTAHDPYYLYGASNIGSMLALLGYPVLLEPLLTVVEQSRVWSALYAVLLALILLCAFLMLRGRTEPAAIVGAMPHAAEAERPAVGWGLRARWVALAFVPSSLMLGVTAYVTTDIAAVPLFWVVPLALYLFTFVLTFSRTPRLKHEWMLTVQPPLVAVTAILFFLHHPLMPLTLMHLAAFFVCAMVCHGELWRTRPDAGRLTEFYLWMSFGGMLGGVFNALVAPVAFDSVLEYPIALALACAVRPWRAFRLNLPSRRVTAAIVVPALVAPVVVGAFGIVNLAPKTLATVAVAVLLIAAAVTRVRHTPLFAVGVAAMLALMSMHVGTAGELLARERSFFSAYAVKSVRDGRFVKLVHGTTVHGAQATDPAMGREPLTYYYREGPFGQLWELVGANNPSLGVGVVGLGVGATACYRVEGQDWVYYEIDPVVTEIARDPRYFSYLSSCAPEVPVVHGDARLSLEHEPQGRFDLLMLDAFASDSIPVHLVTREAIALYLDKLAPDGLLVFQVSNRNIRIEPVLASLFADAGLQARIRDHVPAPEFSRSFALASEWVVAARSDAVLAPFDATGQWRPLPPAPTVRPWTDDYSHVLRFVQW